MKIAYFDCFSGVSGDMCLGALVDIGLPLADLTKALKGLRISGFTLRQRRVMRGHLLATKVDVVIANGMDNPLSHDDIQRLLRAARLPVIVRERASMVFEKLARVEARAHRTTFRKVHFHELGVIDSLVDVVGTLLGCHLLGLEALYASPINVGSGMVKTRHGLLPVPAPATADLLKGLSIYAAGPPRELTTPTGAGLMATAASGVAQMPPMKVAAVGYGAGTFNPPDWPNALRVIVGDRGSEAETDQVMVLETNLDDMNPQAYELLMERLFGQGALDITLTPVIMKRGRPGIVLTVLADPHKLEAVLRVLFAETTTLGVRIQEVARRMLPREVTEISTKFGAVRVKLAKSGEMSGKIKARPEYRDCKRIAEQTGLPLRTVMLEVERSLRKLKC
jgi:pyridinium-3,5-bisthiocarboxylic acid mononucleotide nickel chelatase